jgi:hypothetical protein
VVGRWCMRGRRECSMERERQLTWADCLAKLHKIQAVEVLSTGCHIWPRDGISGLPGSPGSGPRPPPQTTHGCTAETSLRTLHCQSPCQTPRRTCQGPPTQVQLGPAAPILAVSPANAQDCHLLQAGKAASQTSATCTQSRGQESEQAEERRLLTCQDRIGALLLDVQVRRACCPRRWQRRP